MAKVKANKAVIIDAIVKQVEKGESRGKVLGIIGKKWEISRTTFDRYWKVANEQHKELQDKAKDAADKAYIQSSEIAAKRAVMSRAERLEVLSSIARGDITMQVMDGEKVTEVQVVIETLEKLKAISELNKMEGDYAPAKIAQTDIAGNDIHLSVGYGKKD